MPTVVGVRFKRAGKIYYFDPAGFDDLKPGEWVIVETARGIEAGRVVIAPKQVLEKELAGPLKPVCRRADWRDLTEMMRFRMQEARALSVVREKVRQEKLPMKVVRVEYNFNGSRLTVYFLAERRIDFRKLVRELTKTLRTRVEMRQIGVRDEAKLMDGVDKCGLPLCCSTWMTEFPHVSIKTAKNQNLPLNPSEISGICGRLLCCLTFEDAQYTAIKGELPKVGTRLVSAKGGGKVVEVNIIRESATVLLDSGETIEISAEEFKDLAQRQQQMISQ